MSNQPEDRNAINALINRFTESWMDERGQFHEADFNPGCRFYSSHHGDATDFTSLSAKLAEDTRSGPMQGRISNVYTGVRDDKAVASFYSFGLLGQDNQNLFLFGSTQVLQLTKTDNRWRVDEMRLVINWSKGNPVHVPHWQNLPVQSGWQMGFDAPAMISELHAPWVVLADILPPDDLKEALEELYFRYAFAVDQNDMMLLKSSYSEDISGGFAPVGNLSGRDQVIGTLKNFRHLAPYWQHFAEVVRIEEEADGQHVKMIVARIIPERPVDETGNTVYGAHYQLRARKASTGQWQFCWTDYRPGWFTEHSLPEFDIGNPTA